MPSVDPYLGLLSILPGGASVPVNTGPLDRTKPMSPFPIGGFALQTMEKTNLRLFTFPASPSGVAFLSPPVGGRGFFLPVRCLEKRAKGGAGVPSPLPAGKSLSSSTQLPSEVGEGSPKPRNLNLDVFQGWFTAQPPKPKPTTIIRNLNGALKTKESRFSSRSI